MKEAAVSAIDPSADVALCVAHDLPPSVIARKVTLARGNTRWTAPPVVLKAGDVLFIPAGVIHSARNVGTGRGRELATYIVEKSTPLLTLAK